MSMMYCEKHHRQWDSDKLDECPECEHEPEMTVFLCKLDKSKCDHDWNNEGINPTHCLKCGQSFTAYAFMEAP